MPKLCLSFLLLFCFLPIGYSQSMQLDQLHTIPTDSTEKKLNAYLDIIYYHLQESLNYDSALFVTQIAEKDFKDFPKEKILIFRQRGVVYDYLEQIDSSYYYLNKSLNYSLQVNDTKLTVKIYNDFGVSNLYRNELDSATYYFIKGLAISNLSENYITTGALNNNVGIIKQRQKNYKEAASYFNEALKNYKLIENKSLVERKILNIYINLSTCSQKRNRFNEALFYCDNGLNYSKQVSDSVSLASFLTSKGLINYKLGNYESSKKHSLKSYRFFKDKNLELAIPTIYNLGIVYTALEQYDSAIYYNQLGLEIATSPAVSDSRKEKAFYQNLTETFEQKGDYKQAFKYLTLFIEVNDSDNNLEKYKIVEEMERKYAAEKKEHKLLEMNQASEIQQLYLIFLIFFVFFLLIFFYFIYKRRRTLYELLLAKQSTTISQAVLLGQENERKRISLNLHDSVGASLANISIRLSNITEISESVSNQINRLKKEVDNTCTEVRNLSHDLAPYKIEQEGLKFAIDDLIMSLNNSNNIHFKSNFSVDEKTINTLSKSIIYRIIQELTLNVYKHSKASFATVNVEQNEKMLVIQVQDNGIGYKEDEQSAGIGLKNIRTRIAYLNGFFKIETEEDYGVLFTVNLPYSSLLTKA